MTAPAVMMGPDGRSLTVIGLLRSPTLLRAAYPILGVSGLLGLWWLGGEVIAGNPDTAAFSDFAPGPAFAALGEMLLDGSILEAVVPSLLRVGLGLLWAIVIGLPLGILIGRVPAFRDATHIPFQFLRMVSPLSWMPIAVMTFNTWDAAIVFLITAAAIWPVTFATANGLRKVDPAWFKVARNLGARGWHMLMHIIMPAIAQDVLTGVRLALGVAWIVLVPAEYLGVTSGLGYAINDARDILEYDRLAALVVTIGVLGFALDSICLTLIRRYSWVRG
ncbi:MAG: nitrate ABC transporter permease [Rhodospirillaceae bacterium BRH_c57]|nr:MAG: nitrate ABC transporter permease [Rhodospirillaceae bacterium BRH_c57]